MPPVVIPAPTRPRPPVHRIIVAVAALVLVLTGCVAPKNQTTPAPDPSGPAASPGPSSPEPGAVGQGAALDELYAQDVSWSDCGTYECATVRAPLDWADPTAGTIELALERSPSTGSEDERIGSLLINPGGPGSSGIEFLPYAVSSVIGPDVLAAYDVVGFDPRGVGRSSAVSCGSDAAVDEFLTADQPLRSQADVEAARAAVAEFAAGCLEATGPLLGEVDTVSAARDLDLLRAVLGDDELHYLGFSYGTYLGATYAGLYPQNVGRLVLDGGLDPAMTSDELVVGQAIGFEKALRAYVADCQAGAGCPLSGGVDEGMEQIARLIDRITAKPLDAGSGHTLNGTMAFYGIVVTLYDNRSWSLLTLALDEAIRTQRGTQLFWLGNFYLDRTPDGSYTSNSMIAFTSINCLDRPSVARDYEEIEAFAQEVAQQAPTFGDRFARAVGCESWPFPPTGEAAPVTAPGADPILVVGTTGDPATPYAWSVALADQLSSGVLLTWEGEGHTAYGRSNPCLESSVDDYLLDGTVPADGLVC